MNFTDSPFLQAIVEHAPIGICILNADDFFIEILNDRFLEIAGERRENLLGKWYWKPFDKYRESYEGILANVVT